MAKRVAVTPYSLQQRQHIVEPAPFGIDFQGMLIKVMIGDMGFARPLVKYIKPYFFQNEAHAWAWGTALNYLETYGTLPSLTVLVDQAGKLGNHAPIYQAALAQIREMAVTDESWIRDQTLEWVRKTTFMRAFVDSKEMWNIGKRTEVYDIMREAMSVVDNISWETVDRGFYNREEFVDRYIARQDGSVGKAIGTGIPDLDKILEGGAYPGFVGTWIAYPKVGKTTLLTNLGAVSVRAYYEPTLHIVLEGGRLQVESRYDAIFLQELYSNVKAGVVDAKSYSAALVELDHLRNLLVVRGFTDDWDTNILHIDEELKDLKRNFGYEPTMIIVDYGDLLRGRPRPGGYQNETDEQVNAFKDLKRLASRGYRIWTASQAQRPKNDDYAEKPHLLRSKDIADAYAKVRICDFIGSLNQTKEERNQGIMRLYAELYRDNAADETIIIASDFQKMTFGHAPKELLSHIADASLNQPKALGYKQSNSGV